MPSVFRLPRRHDVLWVLLAAELLAGWAAAQPFGLERRVEWTNARLIGSPEPPLPYTVEKVFTRLDLPSPMYVADEPGTEALLVVLQGGAVDKPSRIVQFQNDPDVARSEVVLEVPRRMVYSLCFHPDYLRNRQVFVFSNGETGEKDRTNQITRYVVDREAPFRFNTESAEVVLEWKSGGHDGGDMAFGLDGMLYITTGDGTSDSDTWNSGQTLDELLGSVLRIDV
ncbi:MAG: sorbosone dehydrogenase family protein, partial [Pirellulaceae bacterium]